jgi:hypothetical protein
LTIVRGSGAAKPLRRFDFGIGAADADLSGSGAIGFRVVTTSRTSIGGSVHHRELHSYGHEASWWAGVNIDPLLIALELWSRSQSPNSSET